LDPTITSTEDSAFWINSISYDSDISKLKKAVSDGKGGYTLI
jgi:hypothetical protein